MDTDYANQVIDGRYRIERLLGKGGMGAVYRARHSVLGRPVAVKFLHVEYAGDEEIVKRFYREAQAAASIGHPNIIEVMDVGVSPGQEPYLVMEYLEGESLASLLQRRAPIDLALACGILEPALSALHAAHEKGIVHRDLKPDNIFIAQKGDGPPLVKLIDFGISKFTAAADQSQLTRTGSLLGTPAYMSPEQARGDRGVDARSDIYSMGVILYEMLTGRLPFRGENYNQLLVRILTENPVPPRESFNGFPGEAESIVMDALARQPGDRIPSAPALLERLSRTAGWSHRQGAMERLFRGVSATTFAGGDLGVALKEPGDSGVASKVLSELSGAGGAMTPGGAGPVTETPGAWAMTRHENKRRRAPMIISIAVAALLVAAVVLWMRREPGENSVPAMPAALPAPDAPVSEPPPPPAAQQDSGVQIRVTGIPDGAVILWNGAPVPENPFRVDTRKTVSTLQVTASGFAPFTVSVIPDGDRTIEATLSPLPDRSRRSTAAPAARQDVDGATAAEETTPKKAPAEKFKEGKRGTKFGKTFE